MQSESTVCFLYCDLWSMWTEHFSHCIPILNTVAYSGSGASRPTGFQWFGGSQNPSILLEEN